MKERFIAWLSELGKQDGPIAGGKGANLGEMYNAKFPVPPAFVVTTDAFHYFMESTGTKEKVEEILSSIDVANTKDLSEKAEQIRKLVVATKMPKS